MNTRVRKPFVIVIVAIVVVLFLLVLAAPDAEDAKSATASSSNVAEKAPSPVAQMPKDETEFIRIVSAAQEEAQNAENDMQRGGFKAARDKALCSQITSRTVNDWTGQVTTIDANSDGKGVMAIEIAPNISVKTWNNSFSDFEDHTLIEPGTDLFKTASSLTAGQQVKFSGHLLRGEDGDCFKEGSLTLAGKLNEPEFLFRFSSVSP